MSNNSQVLGNLLEDTIGSILEVLRVEGRVILEFALLRARKYPDFWVLDAQGREWLIESKNLGIKRIEGENRRTEGVKYWVHNLGWVESHILNKRWNGRKYQIGAKSGEDSKGEVVVKKPQPLLVVSHMLFDSEALQALKALFGDFIVILGHQFLGDDKDKLSLYEQLREMFTRGESK